MTDSRMIVIISMLQRVGYTYLDLSIRRWVSAVRQAGQVR